MCKINEAAKAAQTGTHYYAYYWQYGLHVCDFDSEPLGSLMVFDTKAARDAWVDGERYENGNLHREAFGGSEGRAAMIRELRGTNSWGRLCGRYDTPSGVIRDAAAVELLAAWRAEYGDRNE